MEWGATPIINSLADLKLALSDLECDNSRWLAFKPPYKDHVLKRSFM